MSQSSRSYKVRRAVICTVCRARAEASALRVASLVPSVDQAIREIIQDRVQSTDLDWTIEEDTNVPYSSRAGFSTNASYLAYLERTTPKNDNRPPRVILDDDDNDPARDPITQTQLTPLLNRKVKDLQSARGRLVMNGFLHKDPAATTIFQGVVAVLESTKRSAKAKRDLKRNKLIELRNDLACRQDQITQLQQILAVLEEERPRRHPAPESEPALSSLHLPPDSYQQTPLVSRHSTHALLLAAGRSTSMPNPTSATPHSICDLSVLTVAELTTLRRSLKGRKAPGYDMPADFFARWLQVERQNRIKGVPTGPPHWIVDLRDVRGRNTVMSRVPPGPPMTKNKDERDHHRLCLFAVLRVLVIPGAYAKILGRLGIPVAGDTTLRCIFENKYIDPPKDEDVVRLLAGQGVTVQTANDSHQFCLKLLEAHVRENPDIFGSGAGRNLLELAQKELEISGPPPGLHSSSEDLLPPFHGLELAGRRN
ncbi:hypothetical protein K438DRAFT_1954083 [Mycena galopus ATCC 62051]|nr:hypothetical protein K438DRAFT_1954083 [Mycena galopus ATCC 62051]